MKIGNIVSPTDLEVPDEFHVVRSIDESIKGLPTLLIGWDFIDKHYSDYDIFNRQLGPDLYWTFKKMERRDFHAADLQAFIDLAYKNTLKDVEYIFIDLIYFSNKKLIKIARKLLSSEKITTYFTGDMCYININNIIFGIDFLLVEFMNGNAQRLKTKIEKISTSVLSGDDILIEYKNYMDRLDNKVMYIPFLHANND